MCAPLASKIICYHHCKLFSTSANVSSFTLIAATDIIYFNSLAVFINSILKKTPEEEITSGEYPVDASITYRKFLSWDVVTEKLIEDIQH